MLPEKSSEKTQGGYSCRSNEVYKRYLCRSPSFQAKDARRGLCFEFDAVVVFVSPTLQDAIRGIINIKTTRSIDIFLIMGQILSIYLIELVNIFAIVLVNSLLIHNSS